MIPDLDENLDTDTIGLDPDTQSPPLADDSPPLHGDFVPDEDPRRKRVPNGNVGCHGFDFPPPDPHDMTPGMWSDDPEVFDPSTLSPGALRRAHFLGHFEQLAESQENRTGSPATTDELQGIADIAHAASLRAVPFTSDEQMAFAGQDDSSADAGTGSADGGQDSTPPVSDGSSADTGTGGTGGNAQDSQTASNGSVVDASVAGAAGGQGTTAAPPVLMAQASPPGAVATITDASLGGSNQQQSASANASGEQVAAVQAGRREDSPECKAELAEQRRNGASPEQIQRFMDTMYPKLKPLADELHIPVEYPLSLSALESGWLNCHNLPLNNPFGLTAGGGNNLGFGSINDAIDLWKENFGDVVKEATSMDDFAQRLKDVDYNTVNPKWKADVVGMYPGIARRVGKIEARSQGGDE
ncbi:MAG: hypothetical protein HQL37_14980 [Alphaproteobacteria bacterium]|nr:hypothetical protein [Alphaproteobacteria bacterium]